MDRPCIKICDYEDHTGWCLGCGMTRQERKAWKRAPVFRQAILGNLAARLDALRAAGFRIGEAAGEGGKKAK